MSALRTRVEPGRNPSAGSSLAAKTLPQLRRYSRTSTCFEAIQPEDLLPGHKAPRSIQAQRGREMSRQEPSVLNRRVSTILLTLLRLPSRRGEISATVEQSATDPME